MIELDCHILLAPMTPPAMLSASLQSVAEAVRRADHRVAVHLIAGEKGKIWEGRKRGFNAGTAPYVCLVDDDDHVHPEIFVKTLAALREHQPDVLYTGEQVRLADGTVNPGTPHHHMFVVKRSAIADFDHDAHKDDMTLAIRHHVEHLNTIALNEPLYIYEARGRGWAYTKANA